MRNEIKVRQYADRNRPHLKYVVNTREDGKRKRSFFETKARAAAFADEWNIKLINEGREHAEFSTPLRIMAQECAGRLREFGKTIEQATDFFITHLKASENSCTVSELIDKVIAARTKACGRYERPASADYVRDLNVRLGRFKKTFGQRIVVTMTTDEIKKWLRDLKDERTGGNLSPVSRGNYGRVLDVAFNFAVQEKFALSNPLEGIRKPIVSGSSIGILTVTQAARLLENAEPEILPHFAIGLFAGLRGAEIERLDWSEVDFDGGYIEVKAAKAKTAARRLIPIRQNLREWLLPLRRLSGKVTPENFKFHFDKARAAAGIVGWPQNALRHSFASYHLSHFKNLNELTLEMGHTNSQMLFAHYRELVKPKDAERYWNLKPAKVKKIVPITRASQV